MANKPTGRPTGQNTTLRPEQVDAMVHLMEDWPQIALRIMAVRLMMEHRRITARMVSNYAGVSRQWVYGALTPSSVWYGEGVQPPGSYVSLAGSEARLDRLEDIITRMTEAMGGVFNACGCTAYAVGELTYEIAHPKRPGTVDDLDS